LYLHHCLRRIIPAAGLAAAVFSLATRVPVAFGNSAAVNKTGTLESVSLDLPSLERGLYSFSFSADPLRAFGPASRVAVRLTQRDSVVSEKVLHGGDSDLFAMVELDGPARLEVGVSPALAGPAKYKLQLRKAESSAAVEREPNDGWEQASPVVLGGTTFASADDAPYFPVTGERSALITSGVDWYRFRFEGSSPKLVYFFIDLMERDNIPVDVSVFQRKGDKPQPYTFGEDPVALPHEVQALPGNKFTARVLREPGEYFIRVVANHPEYKLRTKVYDVPPYSDPRKAVRTAVDYVLGSGDSWHANTPRRGGVLDRVANVHQETSLCVACHPTHFSQRAQLYAARNGYPVEMREQLRFLSERFYNNPRPLYGFEDANASWARVISAPANVLGRMSHLMNVFEREISLEKRDSFHEGVRNYLKLYYGGREKLPSDETNGNAPLVSTYEVAWYAWEVTRDPSIAALIEQNDIKNLIDLCYQTLALAAVDRERYAERLKRNADRLLSLQRPSGQWAMKFEPDQPEVEFQTGHALWALHAAGIPADHPQVKKAIDYLLKRQQAFGAWMDPLQSYENFRTPFRESQMAVVALSAYFPEAERQKGWNSAAPRRFASSVPDLLEQLDKTWDKASPAVLRSLERLAASPDVLIRQQAVEALGRQAAPSSLPILIGALGDPSKLVQRTAAWAVRQVYNRQSTDPVLLLEALRSSNDRTRWGAVRVFATHFSALTREPAFAKELCRLLEDPVASIQVQAAKGLWQFWFWTADSQSRERIEDAILAGLRKPQHPWVETNLREAIYNIADENVRYLYNNWVPLLADPADRERVIRGRLAIEDRLSRKFTAFLESGSDEHRKRLLSALVEFPLRRADIYDIKADISKPAPPAYNRIGNDIEQILFFGESGSRFAKALVPLAASSDPELRRLAQSAALLVRDGRFAAVTAIAGQPGPERAQLVALLAANRDEAADVLKAFEPPPPPQKKFTASAKGRTAVRPDEGYFRGYVQPIFETRGNDGYACVHCHNTHTLFNATYSTVMNVVDLENPENSLLLRKPISTAETEGTLGAWAHGGGQRFEKDSPEYNTILNWIRGAKP
jgi:hypothetical protein